MVKIAVCDDNNLEIVILKEYFKIYRKNNSDIEIKIDFYSNSLNLIENIQQNGNYDIYLLDVMMPYLNGIELGKKIREINEYAYIIYLTGSGDFALKAFSVRASAYFVKPVDMAVLHKEIDLAISEINKKTHKYFHVKTKNGVVAIPFQSIVYCEWQNHILTVYAADGNDITSLNIRSSMDSAIASLLADERFVKTHQSYLVNLLYVAQTDLKAVTMTNGDLVPVSKSMSAEFKNAYSIFSNTKM